MKTYVATTGIVFALITLAHIWRIGAEGPHLARDPWFIAITVATTALAIWAWRLVRR